MAYVRREQNMVELAYPLKKVWTVIPKALDTVGCNVELVDDNAHRVKAKTSTSLMAWGSVLLIDVLSVDKNTTRVSVRAETPVTTVTALVDYGRTRQTIELFFRELKKQLP